jgi:hypothetical protein
MNLQEFKDDLEHKLKDQVDFDLLEFHFLSYSFGCGTLTYRIHGYNYKFTYDGKDNLLTCERSNNHEKYPNCNWNKIFEKSELVVDPKLVDLLSADR